MATSSVGNLPSATALPAQEAARTRRAAPTEDARGSKAPDGKSNLRQQQNVQILQASMDVSIQSGDSSLALLYRTAIDRINEYLEPELGPNAIGGKDAPDGSPEATAGRILSLSTAFYDAYAAQPKNKDKDAETMARDFVDLIRGGFERGFGEAREILGGLGVLGEDSPVEQGINKTYALVMQGYDDFLASKLGPRPATEPSAPDGSSAAA